MIEWILILGGAAAVQLFVWHSISYGNRILFDLDSGKYESKPRRRRLIKSGKSYQQNDQVPAWCVCGNVSPDGVLRCRLELGHTGWHSHHGPVSWYNNEWAEDDFRYDWRKSNIPW